MILSEFSIFLPIIFSSLKAEIKIVTEGIKTESISYLFDFKKQSRNGYPIKLNITKKIKEKNKIDINTQPQFLNIKSMLLVTIYQGL